MYKLLKGLESGRAPGQRPASLPQVAKAVFWSFCGVRKGKDLAADFGSITPLQVICMGVAGAACFVATLLFIVRQVVN
jgi:hypothetical protein